MFTTGEPFYGYELKVSLYHENGLLDFFVNFVCQPIKDSKGLTTDIMVVATDITEQVEARKKVDESNQRLELALTAGELGSYDVDLTTGVMYCTEQCKKNFGLASNALLNFPELFAAILPQYPIYVQQQIDTAIKENSVYHAIYQITWPDGSKHWISAHGKPRYDNAGNATHMVGVTVDITESKNEEQRRDDFLSIASHELKTPLTSLKGALELLNMIKHNPMSEMHISLIDQANRGMEKITNLVNELLDVNRMREGELPLNKTTFNIAAMLYNSCSHVRMGGYQLIVGGDESLAVHADENRVEQIVVNFVNNAVKYAPRSACIYMTIEKKDGFAKISVRDEGPGIPKEKQAYLFDRYFRADHSVQTASGLGLGLYISAQIIHRHGGQIGVHSEEGKGSTFWFTLPL